MIKQHTKIRKLVQKLISINTKYENTCAKFNNTYMKPYYMALDVETIGLPYFKINNGIKSYYNPNDHKKYDMSRVIRIGYIIYDVCGNKTKERQYIVKPNDFIITKSKFHNITHDIAIKDGSNINTIYNNFMNDIEGIKRFIGHNIEFDINVLAAEFSRNNKSIDNIMKINQICTMKICEPMFKIGSCYFNTYKYPSLAESLKLLFDIDYKLNDALTNAKYTGNIYFKVNKIKNFINT